ncbi:Ig-like domain-containing protein [Luteimicrobium subarcticum]|uniref:Ig-like protein group 3 n=1 Tax=Luteimicrobium subarcticum TaxID=620910 RepID=A0A2M8WT93_9MICO|nr:Ig-like domain-containing protein [Luteimicrobium subarcticum]PJI94165.1 Ig-like protein group 3 [Luteimicrobium subarcticum]
MASARKLWLVPSAVAATCVTTVGLVAPAAVAADDTTGPTITVKPESLGIPDGAGGGTFRSASFTLYDAGKVAGLTLNGVDKDLTDSVWSDLNGVKPGVFGAVEGTNTLVVRDAAGNTTTQTFTLDTRGPLITVKPESQGGDGTFRSVSFKLHDINGKVDGLTLNGVDKDLADNPWSDLNGVVPGAFGAKEGVNTLVVRDTLGNTSTLTFTLDTTGPTVSVKPGSTLGADGSYRSVSFTLYDAGKVAGLTLNGVDKPVTANVWSDLNGVVPGVFGAKEGANTLVVRDVAGNTTTVTFTLDTVGPEITVKPESEGANGSYRSVSFTLHDVTSKVDYLTLNGVTKDLTDNAWSDLNGVVPGAFGAVEGENTLVVVDTLGNTTSTTFRLDTVAPDVTVKPESVAAVDGTPDLYSTVSFKLHDAGQVAGLTLNGVDKPVTANVWSDLNGVKPGVFGAVEGVNTLVVRDVAGNTTTVTFTLDATGPNVTVKPESQGSLDSAGVGSYRSVSFTLHDATSTVDYLTLNGVKKDLTDNAWSDLDGVVPGVFGAVEGENTLVAYDVLGNATTVRFRLDTVGPDVTVKPESVGAAGVDGVYSTVSFALHDAGKVAGLTLNGVDKPVTANAWSDLNGVVPGVFGAKEGVNTLVVRDLAGNTTTVTFTLDTVGPEITVKPESLTGTVAPADGTVASYRSVSFKLHDLGSQVDRVTLNGVEKDLTDNPWSDVNGVVPGVFGAVEGVNTLVAYDVLGNSTTFMFRLDTGRPVVHVTAPTDGAVVRSADVGRVALDASDEGGLSRLAANLYRDGALLKAIGSTPASSALGTTTWSGGWALPANLAEGDYTVRAGATDLAGSWGGDDVTFSVDDTVPSLTVPSGAVALTTGEKHTVDLSQVELHPDWSYVEVDQLGPDGKWQKITGQRYEGTNTFAFSLDGATLTAGVQTQVKITSVDKAGNRTSKTVSVAVSAPAAPSTPTSVPAASVTTAKASSVAALLAQLVKILVAALTHLFG